jgi:hypothetical protein
VAKRRSFHDKTGKFCCGKLRRDLKDISEAAMLADEPHQGMIIP